MARAVFAFVVLLLNSTVVQPLPRPIRTGTYLRVLNKEMERVKKLARLQHQHRHVYQERMHQEAMINNRNQQVFQAAQQLMTGVDHHRGRQDGYNTPVESQISSYHVRQQGDQGAIQFQAQNFETAAFYDAGGNQLVRQETVQERMLEQRDRRISQREYDSSCFAFENFLNILEEEYKQTKDFFLLRRINQLVLSDSHGRDQQNQRALHSIFNRQMSSISSRSAPELNMIYEEQEEMMVEESVRPNGMNGQGGSGQFQNYLNNGYQGNMRR